MRLAVILCMLLLLGLIVYLFYQNEQLKNKNFDLQHEKAKVALQYDSLLQKTADHEPEITANDYLGTGAVLADLQSRPELIPATGNLGGNMYFIRDSFQLIGKNWVYAAYEDGHKMGEAIFSYQKSADGNYQWEILVSRMY